MGLCYTKTSDNRKDSQIFDPKQIEKNVRIEENINKRKKDEKRVIKILLLGSGESGKSTIFKQMKILHDGGFKPEERRYYRTLLQQNSVECMQAICGACYDLQIHFDSEENRMRADQMLGVSIYNPIDLNVGYNIQCLWQDRGVQQCYYRSNEYHLIDSAAYFFNSVERIFSQDYLPTDQDILRSRIATTGIVKFTFYIDGLCFKMFDVGGQRGERKKWIHCFDEVTAILFIASLSEYDQMLLENRVPRNRMKESLFLFDGIINLPWFRNTPIILFLNKSDIFHELIKRVDLGDYFTEYTGGFNGTKALKFIQEQYFYCNRNENKTVYCHITNATDTENIAFVWKCTKHIILEQNLAISGLLVH